MMDIINYFLYFYVISDFKSHFISTDFRQYNLLRFDSVYIASSNPANDWIEKNPSAIVMTDKVGNINYKPKYFLILNFN